MTALIGFACKDSIVLASDSQASFVWSTRKIPDIKKISAIKFAGGVNALIARAGTLDSADYFHEVLDRMAKTASIRTYRDIPNLAENALKETRAKILSQFKDAGLSEDSIKAHLNDYRCDLMLAYYHDGVPYIYKLDLVSALAIKCSHYFEALGCAAGLASFVLTGFDFSTVKNRIAQGIAAYAIEMCKIHDSACGGRTQFGSIMKSSGKCIILDKKHFYHTHTLEATAQETDQKIRDFIVKTVIERINDPAL